MKFSFLILTFYSVLSYGQIVVELYTNMDTVCAGEDVIISMNVMGGTPPYVIESAGNIISTPFFVNPTTDTTIVVNVSDNFGNSGSDSVDIFVNLLPPVSFSPNITSGCQPLTVQFIESSPNNGGKVYNWNFGDNSPIDSINYLKSTYHIYKGSGVFDVCLTVTDEYGCANTQCVENLITVYESPIADFEVSYDDDVVHFENTSSANAVGSYWRYGDGDTLKVVLDSVLYYNWYYYYYYNNTIVDSALFYNNSHTYPNSGLFLVELNVMSFYGCTDTTYQLVSGNDNPNNFIHLYPNPFSENLTFEIDKCEDENIFVYMYNDIGQIVIEKEFEIPNYLNKIEIPLKHLASGIYIVEIKSNSLFLKEKVIKAE